MRCTRTVPTLAFARSRPALVQPQRRAFPDGRAIYPLACAICFEANQKGDGALASSRGWLKVAAWSMGSHTAQSTPD